MNKSAGILGVGIQLPEHVRHNSWWPESFTRRFEERAKKDALTPEILLDRAKTPAQRIQMRLMLETYGDPFRGARQRRILPEDARVADMEVTAARQALSRAGVRPEELDMIIVQSMPSDEYIPNDSVFIQAALGAKRAQAFSVDTGCASFGTALGIADGMIRAGSARYVLLVMSSAVSRMLDWEDPLSANFGDGAGAAVLGPVEEGMGILAHVSRTHGELARGLCVGPRSGAPWYEAGEQFLLHTKDLAAGRSVVMETADYATTAIGEVLERAGVAASEVTRFYSHQPSSFFNRTCREAAGLLAAKTTDTFPTLASVGAANIPVNLFFAQEGGQLRTGDVTVLFAMGAGMTWTASCLRWAARPV